MRLLQLLQRAWRPGRLADFAATVAVQPLPATGPMGLPPPAARGRGDAGGHARERMLVRALAADTGAPPRRPRRWAAVQAVSVPALLGGTLGLLHAPARDVAGGVSAALVLAGALGLLAGSVGRMRALAQEQAWRTRRAERLRRVAELRLAAVRRAQDATQAAILRLAAELQAPVGGAGGAVVHADGQDDPLASLHRPLASLRDAAAVAPAAVQAADAGLAALQGSLRGLQLLGCQLDPVSRRLKRLGERAQEAGEWPAQLADLAEQAQVLALNAAIQAASAGEAGRGFVAVAQQLQRLAERAADAARHSTALVRVMQIDVQDAAGALEHTAARGAELAAAAEVARAEQLRVAAALAALAGPLLAPAATAPAGAGNMRPALAAGGSPAGCVQELDDSAQALRRSAALFETR